MYLRLHVFQAITRAYLVRFIVYDLIHSHAFPVNFLSIALVACAFCYTFSAEVHSFLSLLSLLVTRSRFLYPFTAWLLWVIPLNVSCAFACVPSAPPECSLWLFPCISWMFPMILVVHLLCCLCGFYKDCKVGLFHCVPYRMWSLVSLRSAPFSLPVQRASSDVIRCAPSSVSIFLFHPPTPPQLCSWYLLFLSFALCHVFPCSPLYLIRVGSPWSVLSNSFWFHYSFACPIYHSWPTLFCIPLYTPLCVSSMGSDLVEEDY